MALDAPGGTSQGPELFAVAVKNGERGSDRPTKLGRKSASVESCGSNRPCGILGENNENAQSPACLGSPWGARAGRLSLRPVRAFEPRRSSPQKTSLGTILVTSSGRALYLDAADKPGHPACTRGCLLIWPPLKASGTPKASGGAKAADLGTTKIAGGIKQVTYQGHPLYTFSSDTQSGQTSGEGQNGFYLLSPSGSRITKAGKTATTTESTSTSSSPGYEY